MSVSSSFIAPSAQNIFSRQLTKPQSKGQGFPRATREYPSADRLGLK